MNITEAGNNLVAIQNRLLKEKQALADQIAAERLTLSKHIEWLHSDFSVRFTFLDARIAEIDGMIGADEAKP